jgi:hypothetical protein
MFLCSSASIDITPQVPVSLAGYQGRTQPFERIANNLEANAILLSTRETSILFVALDLAYVGPDIMSLLHSHASRWGLPASNVVAAAKTRFLIHQRTLAQTPRLRFSSDPP